MIRDIIKDHLYRRQPVFSFEFFPPKTPEGETALFATLEKLAPLRPSFVSLTYGAAGSARDRTRRLVLAMRETYGVEVMPHLTCVGHDAAEITALLAEYATAGITNVLALRGDAPRDQAAGPAAPSPLPHAIDLVRLAAAKKSFSIGVAGFPEKHPEARSLATDLRYLREKVAAGAAFVITQLFFVNDFYFTFVAAAKRAGITIPIIPGVMPITKRGQLEKFRELCGCFIPAALAQAVNNCRDDFAAREIGLAYAAAQCADLLRGGAPGIHFYTLNQSSACLTIHAALQTLEYWHA